MINWIKNTTAVFSQRMHNRQVALCFREYVADWERETFKLDEKLIKHDYSNFLLSFMQSHIQFSFIGYGQWVVKRGRLLSRYFSLRVVRK